MCKDNENLFIEVIYLWSRPTLFLASIYRSLKMFREYINTLYTMNSEVSWYEFKFSEHNLYFSSIHRRINRWIKLSKYLFNRLFESLKIDEITL